MAGLSNSYPVYAPAGDLNAYLGETLADADARLADASGVVRYWTINAYYNLQEDSDFLPAETRILNAFHDATILQAAACYRAGIKPGEDQASGASAQKVQSKTLGSRSVTYATDANAETAKAALLGGALAPAAFAALAAVGLMSSAVGTGGYREYPSLMSRVPAP